MSQPFPMISSMVVHVGLLLWGAATVPPLPPTADDINDFAPAPPLLYMVVAEQAPSSEEPQSGNGEYDHNRGLEDARCCVDEGSMGSPEELAYNGRYGVTGPADNPDPHIARSRGGEVNSFFPIGLRPESWGTDPAAPIAPWGRDDALGTDPISANGGMWGNDIEDSAGTDSQGGGISARPAPDENGEEPHAVKVMVERHRHRGHQQDQLRGWD